MNDNAVCHGSFHAGAADKLPGSGLAKKSNQTIWIILWRWYTAASAHVLVAVPVVTISDGGW